LAADCKVEILSLYSQGRISHRRHSIHAYLTKDEAGGFYAVHRERPFLLAS